MFNRRSEGESQKGRKEEIERRGGGREEGVTGVDISKVLLGFVVTAAAAVSGPENIAIVH